MKNDNEEMILKRIDYLREILNEILCDKSLGDEEVLTLSNLLDQLIVDYMRSINQD